MGPTGCGLRRRFLGAHFRACACAPRSVARQRAAGAHEHERSSQRDLMCPTRMHARTHDPYAGSGRAPYAGAGSRAGPAQARGGAARRLQEADRRQSERMLASTYPPARSPFSLLPPSAPARPPPTHARTDARTHGRTRARAHTHTHTHTQTFLVPSHRGRVIGKHIMICGGICPRTNRCRAWRLVGKRGRHSFPCSLVLDQAISRTFYAETARPGIRPGRTRKLCRRVLPWPIFDRYHCSSLRHAQQQAHQGNLIIRPSNLEYS